MKLVINISDTLKHIANEDDFKTFTNFMWQSILMDDIKNGTPLVKVFEDIKAEIDEFKNNEHTYEYGGFDRAYNGIMEIIERHIDGKE